MGGRSCTTFLGHGTNRHKVSSLCQHHWLHDGFCGPCAGQSSFLVRSLDWPWTHLRGRGMCCKTERRSKAPSAPRDCLRHLRQLPATRPLREPSRGAASAQPAWVRGRPAGRAVACPGVTAHHLSLLLGGSMSQDPPTFTGDTSISVPHGDAVTTACQCEVPVWGLVLASCGKDLTRDDFMWRDVSFWTNAVIIFITYLAVNHIYCFNQPYLLYYRKT